MISAMQSEMQNYADAIMFAQELPRKPVHVLNDLSDKMGVSTRTVRRRIKKLEELGLAKYDRGVFSVKYEVVSQPKSVLNTLYYSFVALKKARRFGKFYRNADVNFVKKNLPKNSLITLDYKAYELTGYQTPLYFYVYVENVEEFSMFLRKSGYKEGRNGKIILLPKIGSFIDEVERVFLDCVAHGGRSFNDAVALSLSVPSLKNTHVRFTIDMIQKIMKDMRHSKIDGITQS